MARKSQFIPITEIGLAIEHRKVQNCPVMWVLMAFDWSGMALRVMVG